MSAHTPAPWRVYQPPQSTWANVEDSSGYPVAIKVEPRNASIIAAAPDMLEALQAVMNGQIGGNPDLNAERFRMARAAIAKATCEQL